MRNPFTSSRLGGRVLSASQLPFFLVHPPAGYGVLTTTGRKTGKTRRRCVRAVRSGEHVYIVAIKGPSTMWVTNALTNPEVRVRVAGGTFPGRARKLSDEESEQARQIYCDSVHWFDYLTWINWRKGRPTAVRIRELLDQWFDEGERLVVDLSA